MTVRALDLLCTHCGAFPGVPCYGIAPEVHRARSITGQPVTEDAVADLESALVRTTRELVYTRRRVDELSESIQEHTITANRIFAQWAETVSLAHRALLALEAVRLADSLHEAQDAAADALDDVAAQRPARA